ncbi:hypothetical protein [Ideonella sp. BN130291]|uniref:hypothetical protein n=1 Tax=Ideonella sp. BN130291 TaxID=3112940 RepID=UPI002E27545F|nr:hypothetical protein [Ideonella sp. BN130291]
MNPTEIDPLFLAVAQPVLRGAAGEALLLQPVPRPPGAPAAGAQRWRAQPLEPALQARLPRCVAHSAPEQPLPWWAGHDRLAVLVEGHRPLEVRPHHGWTAASGPVNAPFPDVVSLSAGGLQLFFVNAAIGTDGRPRACVRVFAVDDQRAVEAAPVHDAQVFDAWEHEGQVWLCGMRCRHTDAAGNEQFGHALLLQFELKPLRWVGGDRGPEALTVSPAIGVSAGALQQQVRGIEAWLAHAQDTQGAHWLLGAPLGLAHYSPESPLWLLGAPAPSDYADLVLAHWVPGRAPELARVASDLRWVAGCAAARREQRRWFLARGGSHRLGHLALGDLAVAPLPESGELPPVQPLRFEGLPPQALACQLADLDVVHDSRFGYAASLSWLLPDRPGLMPGARDGACLRSDDGVHWRVVD